VLLPCAAVVLFYHVEVTVMTASLTLHDKKLMDFFGVHHCNWLVTAGCVGGSG